MNIAIVDDNADDLTALNGIFNEYAAVNGLEAEISLFNCAEELLENYRPLQYTVIFMDIYMKKMTGIDAAKFIRSIDRDTLLVFLTSSIDHMHDAFSVHAYDYIQKPVKTEQIFRVLDDILNRRTESEVTRVDVGFTPHTPHGTVRALLTHTALHFIIVPVCKTN